MQHPLSRHIADRQAVEAIAEAAGCSIAHLRNIRAGRKVPSLQLAQRLSEATGLPLNAFVPTKGNHKSKA